jgi:hypothetical protein
VAARPPGLLVTYYPFAGLTDTLRVQTIALEFFRELRPQLPETLPFVAMRAVDVRAVDRNKGGQYTLHSFGVVIGRRGDRWFYNDSTPIPDK